MFVCFIFIQLFLTIFDGAGEENKVIMSYWLTTGEARKAESPDTKKYLEKH